MNPTKKLRYYGTLGPACASVPILYKMFCTGMTGLRLNTSHTRLEDAAGWISLANQAAKEAGVDWELLIDLEGPELRIGALEAGLSLKEGETVFLLVNEAEAGRKSRSIGKSDRDATVSSQMLSDIASPEAPNPDIASSPEAASPEAANLDIASPDSASPDIASPEAASPDSTIPIPAILLKYLEPGQTALLDDGKIILAIKEKSDTSATATVIRGGFLTGRKSIALEWDGVNIEVPSPTLTSRDMENLHFAGQNQIALASIMQPFVRGREDLIAVRNSLDACGLKRTGIMAKIENMTGVRNLENLLPYCDEVIIARGDLGNAASLERLPVVQKQLEEACKKAGKPYMVVTQMLASMQENSMPTRAEVSDIGNAVYCGASSLMLTNETAAGKYPEEAMKVLVDTAEHMIQWMNG